MKLRLPKQLVKAMMKVAAAAVVTTMGSIGSFAGTLHEDVSMQTYTDFGQNMGRYVTGNRVNALLSSIRSEEGITITYTGGQDAYRIGQNSMVSFDALADNGASVAIGYNFIATVQHNDVQNPGFTSHLLPADSSVQYKGIEYRISDAFLLTPDGIDYKITRLSKMVTDVETATLYTGSVQKGDLIYRSGSGNMTMRDREGNIHSLSGPYIYSTGGITSVTNAYDSGIAEEATSTLVTKFDFSEAGVSSSSPLPVNGDEGDSGSPVFVWNTETQQYEYIAAMQGVDSSGLTTWSYSATQWAQLTMDAYSKHVDVQSAGNDVFVSGQMTQGESVTDNANRTAEIWTGAVTDSAGRELLRYNGVQSGVNTWNTLTDLKDDDKWYAYGFSYLNADVDGTDGKMTLATLYETENLVFRSAAAENTVRIDADGVDLGVGYAQFSRTGSGSVSYTVSGGAFNHAGYIVDEDVSVHLSSANTDAANMREWRKVGAGDLYVAGTGNNEVFLNLGGKGTTYLNEKGGYAAYNVLANTGMRVVLQDVNQIARDFTFGNGGAVLDFNGNSMTWNNGAEVAADGFTIHALTEEAVITNGGSEAVTLRVTNGGDSFLGSFRDTATADLNIVYAGAGNWDLHSIRTDLTHGNSGFAVESGSVTLSGTQTVHGMGSVDGRTAARLERDNDWHYADAAMPVTVQGGTFTLGSHARLQGDVTVANGGTFVMNEAVQHQMEYVEGGSRLENTDKYADFVGLKGNVMLNGGAMRVEFSEGTDTTTTYGEKISGNGSLTVATGNGTIHLAGDNSAFSGTRTVENGTVSFADTAAMGDTSHTWLVKENGVLVMPDSDDFSVIDTASTGVIALSRDTVVQALGTLDIGAADGATVHYGAADTALESADGKWVLGGGGGNLVVDFRLEGANQLVLGNGHSTGTVTLTNSDNSFTGGVVLNKGIRLEIENAASLGNSQVLIGYGALTDIFSDTTHIDSSSTGALLIDVYASQHWDVSSTPGLSLAAVGDAHFTGSLTLAEGADYRLGGAGGTLTMATALDGAHGLVVDGQGSTGGKVVLTEAATLTGSVTVQGYDAALAGSGDVTLSLTGNNALNEASSVTVQNNGILELNGTEQCFRQLTVAQQGAIIDSSAEHSGSVNLNGVTLQSVAESTDVLRVQGAIITTGANEVTVAGASDGQLFAGNLTVKDGSTLYLQAENLTLNTAGAFVNNGALVVDRSATLSGGTFNTAGGTITAHADLDLTGYTFFNGNRDTTAINRLFAAAQGGGGTIQLSNGVAWLNMDAAADIAARFSITGGDLQLNSHYQNYAWRIREGGSLTLSDGRLMLENTAHVNVAGGELNAAQGIVLGHAAGSYAGHLAMESGSITTQSVMWRHSGNSFTMNGGKLTVTGEQLFTGDGTGVFTVTGGTLAATTGSWALNHDVTLGAVSVETAADKTISFTGQTILTSTLHNVGNISFAMEGGSEGTRLLLAEGNDWESRHTYSENVSSSDFEGGLSATDYMLISGSTGSTVNVNGRETISVNGTDYAMRTDGSSAWFSAREFIVNSGTLHFGAADNAAEDTDRIRMNGGTLSIEKELNGRSVTIAANQAVNVAIAQGVAVQAASLYAEQGGSISLSGNGEYDLTGGTATLTSGVSLSDDWKGEVRISNYGNSGMNVSDAINNLGNKGTTVGLTGVNGWITRNGTVSANLDLKDDDETAAYTINNGYKESENHFSGAISGDGTLSHNWEPQYADNYSFDGDISSWTGVLENKKGKMGVVFTKASSIVKAEIRTGEGADLAITTNGAATVFNKGVHATTLTTHGNVTFNADSTIDGRTTLGAMAYNNADMNLRGGLAVSGSWATLPECYDTVSQDSDNGFSRRYLVLGGAGSSIDLGLQSTVSINGTVYDLHTGNGSAWIGGDQYTVNTNVVFGSAANDTLSAASLLLNNGANLTIAADLGDRSVQVAANAAATVDIAQGMQIHAAALDIAQGGSLALTGQGTLNIDGNLALDLAGHTAGAEALITSAAAVYSNGLTLNNYSSLTRGEYQLIRTTNAAADTLVSQFADTEQYELYNNNGVLTLSVDNNITFTTRQFGSQDLRGYRNVVYRDSRHYSASAYAYGGAIFNDDHETFTLSGNESVTFSGNSTAADGAAASGGAIYNQGGTFTLSGNESVTFSGNSTATDGPDASGGAIFNGYNSSTFTLSDNGNVTFRGNSASGGFCTFGGAIYNQGDFLLSGNGNVSFIENCASYIGGAICNNGTYKIKSNETVSFVNNSADEYGAIWNESVFDLSGNSFVLFSGNSAVSAFGGGAIGNAGDFSICENGEVVFVGNSALRGSAICNDGTFTLSDNGNVTFIGNASLDSNGAICNQGTLTLSDNGNVTFSGNSVSGKTAHGGAIDNTGATFTLSGNGNVLFEKNAEITNGIYRLRSIYSGRSYHYTATLNLSASEGKSILFRDSVYASGTVNLNTDGTGDIIFTGATTEADLREVKGGIDGTAQEIADSRSSVLDATVTLGGGTLQVRDAASLTVKNLTADDGSELMVHDASFTTTGNTTLAAVSISGNSSLTAQDGATLTLTQAITNNGVLTLTGTFNADALEVEQIDGSGYINAAGERDTSGFLADISATQLALTTGAGTVNSDAAIVMYHGNSLTLGSNGIATLSSTDTTIDYSTYYINGGTANLSAILTAAPSAAVQMAGGTLTVDTDCTTEIRHDKAAALTFTARQTGGKEFSGYAEVGFSNNSGDADGGAIANESSEPFTLSGNGDVTFNGNSAGYGYAGGAIANYGSVVLSNNGNVTFSENSVSSNSYTDGGAIYNANDGTFTVSGNKSVIFSKNIVSHGVGGAISNYGTFALYDNESVIFSRNSGVGRTAAHGGAIENYNGNFSLSGNGDVIFSGNSAAMTGGAIFNDHSGTFTLSNNDNVTFSGNSASDGGAICNIYSGAFTLSGNESVTFSGNSVSGDSAYGSAIYNSGTFTLSGNGDVLFEKNAEITNGTYRLRSIYSERYYSYTTLNLSASTNKSILFRDSVYASGTVNLNTDGTGDIIFTGATTEADLREVKGGVDGTAQEIADSRSSVLDATVTLGGGTLQVRDAASLTVRNLTAADGSELVLHDGSFTTTGYSTLADVSISGNSSIAAQDGLFTKYAESGISGDLRMESGSVFENNGNALTIGGTLSVAQDSSVVLSGAVKVASVSLQQGATVELMEGNALLTVGEGVEELTFSGIDLTGSGMRGSAETPALLDNALLKLAEGTSFTVENMVLGAHTRITDDPAALELNNATVMLAAGVNVAPVGMETIEEVVLAQCGGQQMLTTPAGSTVMQLEASTFDSVTLTGNTLALKLSGIDQSELQSYTYVGVSFINGGDYARFDSDLVVTLTLTDACGHQTLTGWYRADEQAAGGISQVLFETAMMPEPATATLSLLALAALSARRRRK